MASNVFRHRERVAVRRSKWICLAIWSVLGIRYSFHAATISLVEAWGNYNIVNWNRYGFTIREHVQIDMSLQSPAFYTCTMYAHIVCNLPFIAMDANQRLPPAIFLYHLNVHRKHKVCLRIERWANTIRFTTKTIQPAHACHWRLSSLRNAPIYAFTRMSDSFWSVHITHSPGSSGNSGKLDVDVITR